MTGKAWSYSRLTKYEKCPRQFKFSAVDRIPEVPSPAMERGKLIHKQAEDYLNGKNELPPPVAPALLGTYAAMREYTPKLVENELALSQTWKATGWFADDCWLRVKFDVVLLYGDDTAEVADHKTGKKYGSSEEQMELYGVSLMSARKSLKEVRVRLLYVDVGEQVYATVSRKDVPALRKQWEKRASPLLRDEIFAPKPGPHCRWCSYSRTTGGQCEFG